MNRKEIEKKMMDMGFAVANRGFGYIADVLESIHQDGGVVLKMTATYAEIGKKNGVSKCAAERCIRHEIGCYYNQQNIHPMLKAKGCIGGRYPNREFLARLYQVIYDEEA